MFKDRIKSRIIDFNKSIMQSLELMDSLSVKLLFIFDKGFFKGIITIGDIQRAIIAGIKLECPVSSIIQTNKIYAVQGESLEVVKNKMLKLRAECMPVVDGDGNLVNVFFWEDLFDIKQDETYEKLDLPVVIMAGGKGTRLAPLTNVYPKPLIPVGQKTIVESIMDKFVSFGCRKFFMSVNYKADSIKNYFDFIANPDYQIEYFQEEMPMGTAGSLRLLKNRIQGSFFVSNCDILIEEDYSAILNYHRANMNELTVVAAVKTLSIPYGTITTGENGLLKSIEEKPVLSFKINTGLYILESSLLNDIPNDFFHITDLMEKLKLQGRRVGVYPISQNDWKDMGDWNEYLKMIKVL